MAIPAARASRTDRKRVSRPSSTKRPENSACTPAMIFISVLFPAPFSPTRPWISPAESAKSTPRSASTPPKAFVIWCSSRMGERPCGIKGSDQEMILHPLHARRVGLGHDRTVRHDALRDALSALFARSYRGDAGDDGAALDAARRIADRGEHTAFAHRPDCRRHGVNPADQDVGTVVRLHDVVGGKRHVFIVEEGRFDLRVFGEVGLPQPRRLRDVPVRWLGIEHFDVRILLY